MGLDVTNVAASLVMPSVESSKNPVSDMSTTKPNLYHTSSVAASSSSAMSAVVQAAAQQVLQSRVAEAKEVTGVTLPSFYNPAAVNPMKYAQQIQKRKLLWGNKVCYLFFLTFFQFTEFLTFCFILKFLGENRTTDNGKTLGSNGLHSRPRRQNDCKVQTADGHQKRSIRRR